MRKPWLGILRTLVVFCVLYFFFTARWSSAVYAEIPQLLNYQGRLTDAGGEAIVGDHAVTFRIYDAESSGSKLWEETHQIRLAEEDNGIFSIVLGSLTAFALDFNRPLWLSIAVDGAEEMSPRQRLTAASYAINADTLDGLDSGQFLRADVDAEAKGQFTLARSGLALLVKPSTNPAANTKLFDVENAAGASKFSVDLEGDVSVAGNLSVAGTIGGATSTTGTTSTTWTIGSQTGASNNNLSLLFGQLIGQESIVFQGAGEDDFVFSDDIRLSAQAQLRLEDDSGGEYVALRSPSGVTTYSLTLPAAVGNAGQILSTDASGNLSWVAAAGGTVTSIDSGAGLIGGPITSAGTLHVGAGAGLQINPDDVAVKLYSGPGLIADATGVSLLRSCADGQLLKWSTVSSAWECAADNAGGGGTVTSIAASGGLTATPNPITSTGTISIATEGVTSAHVADGTLTAADLGTDSVGAEELRSDAIQPGDIEASDLPAHASQHRPGGSDPIPTGTAVNIGSANSEGSSTSLARADHVHQGVHSVGVSGQPQLFGDVSLAAGTNVALSQAGQAITISAPAGNKISAFAQNSVTISTTSDTNLVVVQITKSQTASVLFIEATVQLDHTGGASQKLVDVKLFRDTTQLDANYSARIGTANRAVSEVPVSAHYWDTSTAGTYTFSLRARSSGAGARATVRRLTVLELL